MTNKKFNANKVREIVIKTGNELAYAFKQALIFASILFLIDNIALPTFISTFENTPTSYESYDISYGETIYLHDISIEDIDLKNNDEWILKQKVDDDSVALTLVDEEISGSCCIFINNVPATINFV